MALLHPQIRTRAIEETVQQFWKNGKVTRQLEAKHDVILSIRLPLFRVGQDRPLLFVILLRAVKNARPPPTMYGVGGRSLDAAHSY